MKYTVHPEVQQDIQKEYNRLNNNYPHLSADIKLKAATEYVRANQMADTAILLHEFMGSC